MKRIFPLILPIIALLIIGCSSDDTLEVEALDETSQFTPVGNPVEVTLNLSTLPFTVDEATRAEEPVTYEPTTDDELQMLADEKKIYNLWVFEYDKATEKLIGFPQYFTVNTVTQAELNGLEVKLSDNYGEPVIIYIVADADAGTSTSQSQNWVVYDKEKKTYPGFETIEALEANTLPTAYISETQRSASGQNWPPYYYRSANGSTVYDDATCIPKSGSVEVEEVYEGVKIPIELTNMYAKLMLYVDFTDCDLSTNSNEYISYRFAIDNIPNYCTVGALATAETTTRGAYPSSVVWGCYGAPYYSNSTSVVNLYDYDESSAILLETIYVPENIQGDNSSYNRTSSTNSYPPASDSKITSGATLNDNYFSTTYSSISVYDKTDAIAMYFAWDWYGYGNATTRSTRYLGWYGPVFPGGNETTNFNVRRNCTYRVIMHFTDNGVE